jgi:replicative DNA helicase
MVNETQTIFLEPHFELILLRSILRGDKQLKSLIPYINKCFFDVEENKAIFAAIAALHETLTEVPTLTMLKDHVQKHETGDVKVKAINCLLQIEQDIVSFIEDKNEAEYVFEQAKKFVINNRMTDALRKSISDINTGNFSTVIKRLQEAESLRAVGSGGLVYLDPMSYANEKIEFIKSGFHFFDNVFGGGFPKKSLIAFAGSQKSGKSMMLLNIAGQLMLRNTKVLFVSLELSELMQKVRLDAMVLNKDINIVKNYPEKLNEVIEQIKKEFGVDKHSLIIKEFPMGTANVNDIRCYVDILKAKYSFVPEVIVIDYIDHTTINSIEKAHDNNPWIKEAYTYREAKALASQLNCCVITAFQRTKNSGNKIDEEVEQSLGGSVDKTRIADATIVISQNQSEQELNQLRVSVLFNRFGESRANQFTLMGFNPARCHIRELTMN